MKTKVQATSVISFYSILSELNKRQLEVLKAMKKLGTANNLQVAKYLNLPINSITPRMNELREKGIIIYHHTAACPFTGRSTRFFRIKSYQSDLLNFQ